MQQLPFRAVASDMDGTLLNADHVVGEFTVKTLQKLARKGVNIILATGRGYTDVASTLAKMEIENALMITSNGAQVHNRQGELLYANLLPEAMAFDIMQMDFDPKRVCLNTYQGNHWFINTDIPQLHKYHKDSGFSYQVVDFSRHHGEQTEKIFFIGKTPQDLVELEGRLYEKFGDRTSITYSTPICLEVMNKNVSKATALAHIIRDYDYGLEDCIAFGDGMNDVGMLSEVGKGCIMENADPRLLAALPQLERIGSHKCESVAAYLRAIFGIY
ncbi:hypothetical protein EDC45_1836 [Mesocricetibacter intestinalis]|uniref:Cof subfamily protein (Haloacid dehalogenase superfamily)/HAD superfamily hydrolase (TIGR01484 family) n=1 Tax=Mesocricetibacter intestinalis TaxID=1521930 RepID=A0A4R6VG46_9PAST|nr:Cof-type HAD-IIB family hydrolase [Mesocricetibacter intestinalis]TDQ56626.1 hypothetical protein EDC45_1836 [Mesocricetibacter intestinalis]